VIRRELPLKAKMIVQQAAWCCQGLVLSRCNDVLRIIKHNS
jgi:hypothetical protein